MNTPAITVPVLIAGMPGPELDELKRGIESLGLTCQHRDNKIALLRALGVDHEDEQSRMVICPQPAIHVQLCLLSPMPDADSMELCRKIKSSCKLPVVLLCENDDIAHHVLGIEAGADDIHFWPASLPKLLARIQMLIKRQRHEEELRANYEMLKNIHRSIPQYCRQEREVIDQYEVLGRVGEGVSSLVYRVCRIGSDRPLALKIIKDSVIRDINFLESFRREIDLLCQLDHPNLVRIHDRGVCDGFPYLVMDLAEGDTLQRQLDDERGIPFSTASLFARQLAGVLDYIHSRGVIHRDVKPDNIIDVGGILRLTDFGLSSEHMNEPQTINRMVGTPLFMAPEIFVSAKITPMVDIYAYGICLFALFTGRLPFRAYTVSEAIHLHCTHQPPDMQELVPGLPGGWYTLVEACLAKNPAARPASLMEFTRGFDPALYGA